MYAHMRANVFFTHVQYDYLCETKGRFWGNLLDLLRNTGGGGKINFTFRYRGGRGQNDKN